MKNIQVDRDGEMRCWNCSGKHFQDRRTGRAHVVGYVTVGVGALATKKKLRCKRCGKYNDTGSADPYTGESQSTTAAAATASDAVWPIELKVLSAKVSFDGDCLTIKRLSRKSTIHVSEIEAVRMFDKAGFGAAGVWFQTVGAEAPAPKKVGIDPHGFSYMNDIKHTAEVRVLVDAVRSAIE